jgi:hypothetical protein
VVDGTGEVAGAIVAVTSVVPVEVPDDVTGEVTGASVGDVSLDELHAATATRSATVSRRRIIGVPTFLKQGGQPIEPADDRDE